MKMVKGVPMKMMTTRSNHHYLIMFKRLAGCHKPQILALSYLLPENAQKVFRSSLKYAVLNKPDLVIEGFLLLGLHFERQLMWNLLIPWWENKNENSRRRQKIIQSWTFFDTIMFSNAHFSMQQPIKHLIGSHTVL